MGTHALAVETKTWIRRSSPRKTTKKSFAAFIVQETTRLIASDKVEGTPVRRPDGEKLGSIERVMIDKRTGKVAYAVMTFGGFLGIGNEYRALPWSMLRYNPELDAYELNVTEDQLRNAPGLTTGWDTGMIGRDWERNVHDYYRASPYW